MRKVLAMRNKTTLFLACSLLTIAQAQGQKNNASQRNAPQVVHVEGDVEYTHDPSIARDGDTWYLFGTANGPVRKEELPIRSSHDLHLWKLCGYVIEQIPEWIKKQSPETKELWAIDNSFFKGEYHLYYDFSVFGKN